jgi:hypothetical protein
MKKLYLLFVVGITIILSSCVSSNNTGSQRSNTNFSFSEMFFDHNLLNGETIITFYNLPEYFKKYLENGNGRLYDDYFNLEQFAFYDEGFNTDRGIFSYKLLLKAKNQLLQNENITAILSKILNREVSVGYMQKSEMTKDAVRPWAISFDFNNNMYFNNGNATAVYQNNNLLKVMYIFDLSKNKIEFGFGYKK